MFFDFIFLPLVIASHLNGIWATPTTVFATSSSNEASSFLPLPTSSLLNASTNAPDPGVYANDEVHCFTQNETLPPFLNSTDCVDLLNSLYVTLMPLLPQRNFSKGLADVENAFPVQAHWSLRSCSVLVDSEVEPNMDVFRTYDVLRLAYDIFNQCVNPPKRNPLGGKAYAKGKGFFVAIVRTDKIQPAEVEGGGD